MNPCPTQNIAREKDHMEKLGRPNRLLVNPLLNPVNGSASPQLPHLTPSGAASVENPRYLQLVFSIPCKARTGTLYIYMIHTDSQETVSFASSFCSHCQKSHALWIRTAVIPLLSLVCSLVSQGSLISLSALLQILLHRIIHSYIYLSHT